MKKETLDIWARRDGKDIWLSIGAKGEMTKEVRISIESIPEEIDSPVRIIKFN